MSEIKTVEEILYEAVLKKFPHTTKGEFEETIRHGNSTPIALEAMEAYHLQFKPSDEEIEQIAEGWAIKKEVKDDVIGREVLKALTILRDKIFK